MINQINPVPLQNTGRQAYIKLLIILITKLSMHLIERSVQVHCQLLQGARVCRETQTRRIDKLLSRDLTR